MVKIRVQRKKEKRRERTGIILPALLFFILFPYIISGFSNVNKQTFSKEESPGQIWVLEKKLWGTQRIPLEEYLVGMLAATIPAEYETDTLKAQAIILRSFCMNQMEKENGRKVIYDDLQKGGSTISPLQTIITPLVSSIAVFIFSKYKSSLSFQTS